MKLYDLLMEAGEKQNLGHFYIVEATGSNGEADKTLQDFIHVFIRDYYKKIEHYKGSMEHLMDHPDVFVLGNLTDAESAVESPFTVAESEALARFFEFKPVQSRRKFAVITEAHRVNTIVANKWLKLLEEPYQESTIFLLNPRRQKLLDTIHSRAIHLRLPVKFQDKPTEEWEEFLASARKLSLSQFLEAHLKGDHDLSFWINELIRWEAEENDHARPKTALTDWIKTFQEMEIFHQPAATKWSLFYSYVHEHVLPRYKHP